MDTKDKMDKIKKSETGLTKQLQRIIQKTERQKTRKNTKISLSIIMSVLTFSVKTQRFAYWGKFVFRLFNDKYKIKQYRSFINMPGK